jgi:hypothetical protein
MTIKKKLLTRRNLLRSSLAAPAILTFPRGLILPARATCTAGPPSQAAAWNLNTLAFCDDFNTGTVVNGTLTSGTTTIDLGETNAAGYNWYTKPNNWPNGGDGATGGWEFVDTGNGITPSKINVSNSILSITGGGPASACAGSATAWHGWVVNGAVGLTKAKTCIKFIF